MAATIQTQPTQQQPPSLLNNKSVTNPQLKRIVYSKYRELLGSYNDKANAIIDSLPAYMVKEDRGFHFDPQIINDCDNVVYGTPPAPPPLSAGSLPSQRLSTQIPQYNVAEAPACVQNAMMTKDKKPFTYTPGGIDLSQIKSQRMAKRLARNAQSEGATGQQQQHRPTQLPQQQSNGGSAPGVAASQLGATAMGMPFQVLPTGPPPPPPQPGKVGAPPPPPPAPQNKLAPQSNGNAPRRSPTPQNFEPPPMGFRPEIKIPANPMASLKKVPPPQEKNNFWMEEYRKERSKSPMVGNDENDNNRSSPNNPKPETNQYSYTNNNNSQQNDYQPQQNQFRAPQSPQPMRQQQDFYNQRQPSPPRTPTQQVDQQRRNESPYQPQYSHQQQQQQSPSIQRQTSQYASPQPQPQQQSPTIQRQPSQQYQNSPQHSPQVQRQQSIPTPPQYHQSSPQQSPSIQRQQTVPQAQYQSPTSPQYQQQQQQQQQQQTSPTQQQSVPWRQQKQAVPLGIQNNVSRPRDVMSPAPAESPRPQPQSQQQQQQYPAYLRSREALSPAPEQQSPQMSQPYQQKNAQVGSIYIPPVANQQQQQQYSPYQDSQGSRQQQQQQQTPRQAPTNRWMNAQGQTVETPTLNRIKSPPPPSPTASSNGFGSNNNTGLRLQINNNATSSNAKERIIPIQLEQTPTPTRTPSAPGFGPQPFYNSAQQYSSVPSPPIQGTPNNGQNSPNYVVRSPNQFVDQGYNQYPGVQDHPSRVTSPPMQQQSSRIIQQTNTAGGVMTRIIPIAIESQPDGPLNPNNARGPISQQPIVIQNDPRNQNTWGSGSATPTQSKSFRILQKITDTSDDSALENKAIESDGGSVGGGDQEPQLQRPTFARQMTSTGQINSPNAEQMKRMQLQNEQGFVNRARNQGTPPVMKQPQPNRYVSQRPVYSPDEHSQQYVHPSEQQVPEPKIYTGSAIPSRSFKILQAMTTPENAGPGQSDL